MKNVRILRYSISAMIALAATSVSALGMVSRACNFRDLPTVIKAPALILFQYLGMPEGLRNISSLSLSDQGHYWIHESITTDYGNLRYYLFAQNEVYVFRTKNDYYPYFHSAYRSPWAAQTLDQRIFPDSRLSVFNFNRGLGILSSARAGHPEIIRRTAESEFGSFYVLGQHYYYDAVSKVQAHLGTTSAYDCNLTQWGLEER